MYYFDMCVLISASEFVLLCFDTSYITKCLGRVYGIILTKFLLTVLFIYLFIYFIYLCVSYIYNAFIAL